MPAIFTAFAAFAILSLQSRGFRGFEAVITVLVGVIVAAFAFEVVLARPSVGAVAAGLLTPRFSGTESVLLGAGILGATVMPHVIYLHSALTQRRVVGATEEEQKKIFNFEKWDVVIAMGPALVVIAIGLDPTRALVLSQVVLSFGIPFALIPLLLFCRDRGLMGTLVNKQSTTALATLVIGVILSLNVFLIYLLVSGR